MTPTISSDDIHCQSNSLAHSFVLFRLVAALDSHPDVVCAYFDMLHELSTKAPQVLHGSENSGAIMDVVLQLALASLRFEGSPHDHQASQPCACDLSLISIH